jgi:hypothetical protein
LPVGVAWTTLHEPRRDTKSIAHTAPELRKRPWGGVRGDARPDASATAMKIDGD